jgi:hypothetical protein
MPSRAGHTSRIASELVDRHSQRQSGLRRQRDLRAGDGEAALLPVVGRQFRRDQGAQRHLPLLGLRQ